MSAIQRMQNYRTKRAWPRSRDLLFNFGSDSISPERLKKLEISCADRLRCVLFKACKIRGKRGVVYVT